MDKIERQLNLVALLMSSRLPLPVEKIGSAFYSEQSDVAFKRMFERDKEELRALGLRVELAPIGAWGDEGYVVRRDEAVLPPLDLTADEHAALMLAAAAAEGELAAGDARMAVLKLDAAAREEPGGTIPWILPRVELGTPNLDELLDAVARRKLVGFSYRSGGAGEPSVREVEPHALRYRGAWYLTGRDCGHGGVRHFKLDRFAGRVKVAPGEQPDFVAPDTAPPGLPEAPWEGEPVARVAFAPEVAWWAERQTGARRVAATSGGWVEVFLGAADEGRFVEWILGFADRARVLEPERLRDEVVARLKRAASG